MTKKEIKSATVEKMIEALLRIQETHIHPDYFNNPEGVKNTKTFYFCGLADTLQLVTGNEYHYSTTDNQTFSIIEIISGKEKVLYTTPELSPMKIKTPRGTFKIRECFTTGEEARKNGYGLYFHHEGLDIYTKPIPDKEHCVHFATVETNY